MYNFHLYRLKVERDRVVPLLAERSALEIPPAMIVRAVSENPMVETRVGTTWRIGNVSHSDDGLEFAFGRITKSIVGKYDAVDSRFVESAEDQAPYTQIIFDSKFQVCAIATNSKIATKNKYIAKNFVKALNKSTTAQSIHINFVIDEILDPKKFIDDINEADVIRSFSITFGRPNPWDVEHDFVKPSEKVVEKSGATSAKTEIKGKSLDKDVIKTLARTAASVGKPASASIRKKNERRFVRRYLRGNPAEIQFLSIANIRSVIIQIQKRYQNIRQSEND